jgi:hypothetical protein
VLDVTLLGMLWENDAIMPDPGKKNAGLQTVEL